MLPTFGLGGLWQGCEGSVFSWRPCGPIASSSRPVPGGRGRAARALIGTTLGLIAEDAQTSTAVPRRGPGVERRWPRVRRPAIPPASRAAGSRDGNDSSGNQRAEPPGRPDKRDSKRKRTRRAGRTSLAKAKAKARARASSTLDRSRACSSRCWAKERRRSSSTSATASDWSAEAWCNLGRDGVRPRPASVGSGRCADTTQAGDGGMLGLVSIIVLFVQG
jgi:hypothetical protein